MRDIRFLVGVLLALFSCQASFAQEYVLTEDDYVILDDSITEEQDTVPLDYKFACVNYAADMLVFPAGMSADFRQLLRNIGDIMTGDDKRVNIMHIGGSHVQADVFSHRVRSNFSSAMLPAVGARGCLFPFQALKTNASSSYRMKAIGKWSGARNIKNPDSWELGIMGAAIKTSDPEAYVSLQLNTDKNGMQYDFTTLTILGESYPDEIMPSLQINGETIEPERVEADFRTIGYRYRLPYSTTQCEISFPGVGNGNAFTLRGIIPENDTPGIAYTASGVNGAAVPSWLGCTRFLDELKVQTPELVIFAIGINDASTTGFNPERFRENYRKLIWRFKAVNPACCFIFITNNDCFLNLTASGKYINPNTQKVQEVFYDLARETQGAVFDVYEIMGGKGSSNRWVAAGLMNKDHIHFTGMGYRLLGDMLYNAINNEVVKNYSNQP